MQSTKVSDIFFFAFNCIYATSRPLRTTAGQFLNSRGVLYVMCEWKIPNGKDTSIWLHVSSLKLLKKYKVKSK